MANRVLITGMNMITSLGLDIESSWEGLIEGKSGVKKISLFDASALSTIIAAQIPDEFEEYAKKHIIRKKSKQMTRVSRMCYVCAVDAIEKSGIQFDLLDKTRCCVLLGVVSTANTSVEKDTTPQNRILKSMNNAMSAWISLEYGLQGPNFTVASACSSSAYAIALAYDFISLGKADVVIAGGADSIINPEEIEGFNNLFALSTENEIPEKASRPFSKNRDGFVIGEGAGILILESEASAKKRQAKIYGEIAAYALTSEAYNIMAPAKDGEGIATNMKLALKNAGLKASDIDYINAHGTSTTLNDKYETLAIKKVFGEYAYKIPVSSSKSMIGHTIGAAGAIELIISTLAINKGIIPPTINYDIPDPELDLDFVPNKARKQKVSTVMSNSFAFGGHNASLIVIDYKP